MAISMPPPERIDARFAHPGVPSMLAAEIAIRLARPDEVDRIEMLQRRSFRWLAARHYTPLEIASAIESMGTLDPALIEDGTYYVAESGTRLVGCGGWSFRPALYGANEDRRRLDPASEPARIRAIYAHPDWSGRGIARRLVSVAEAAAAFAGFRRLELLSTLNAEPVYLALGYRAVYPVRLELRNGVSFAAVCMSKDLEPAALPDVQAVAGAAAHVAEAA
jgi:GNAT superfamily N-acetyltransferase